MLAVITGSPIRVGAVNRAVAVVLVKGAALSGVAPKAVDLARVVRVKVDKADREETAKTAIKAKKFTMISPLL